MIYIESALHHLYEKVKNDPKSTANEIESINTVVEWINNAKKESIQKNSILCKLYAIHFTNLLDHFKDIEFAQKTIHKEISQHKQFHYEFFRLKLNNLERHKFLNSLGFSPKSWQLMTDEELEEEAELIKNNQEQFLKHSNKWSYEKIHESLENQISEAINLFQHYD